MDSKFNKSLVQRLRDRVCTLSERGASGKALLRFLSFVFLLLSTNVLSNRSCGQAANIDQIRNSNTFPGITDPLWVNGNAGASNSHYVEGHSIAYRVLLTGLTAGKQYSIVLGYDT